MATELPALAYVGDVNVQSFCHGASLLHRLLADYPPEKLMIVETSWIASEPARRLRGVRYVHHRPRWTRVFHQRFARRMAPLLARIAELRWRAIARITRDFAPRAMLTVAHDFSWLAASSFAKSAKLPLHLIVHDDWTAQHRGLAEVFRRHYRGASSRLCVSPFMEEMYRETCGVGGTVLMPARASDVAAADVPPAKVSEVRTDLTFAFAGTLHHGYDVLLRQLAAALKDTGGRLLLFGPMDAAAIGSCGLDQAHVQHRGMLRADELVATLRAEADVLYVPMSCDEADRANTMASFPSKLADYTATGLPVMIHGPSWASAVKWAKASPGTAMIVEGDDATVLSQSVNELIAKPALREELARGAIAAGNRYFSAEAASRTFQEAIMTGQPR